MADINAEFAEADILFKRLNVELAENIDSSYFSDTKDFRSLIEVLKVLGGKADQIDKQGGEDLLEALKHQNPAYSLLINQQKLVEKVIEDVVTFQHGGLNNSVDTMTAVVREYSRGQEEITALRRALVETKTVLTARKSGQLAMKDLWLRKKELDETLRILNDLEWLKDSPLRVHRLVQQKKYFNAVVRLKKALERMFSDDLVDVTGISSIREQLLELKGRILEDIVSELRNDVVGMNASAQLMKSLEAGGDSDDDFEGESEGKSATDVINDSRSVFSGEIRSEFSIDNGLSSVISKSGSNVPFSDGKALGLLAVDDSVEMNISDVASSGSVYIRLLVRAVGLLRYDDDLERLLLESSAAEFVNVIQRYRIIAFSKLKAKVNRLSNNDDSIEIDQIISKEFAIYITALLDAALTMLRKLLYVLRLLSFSKYLSSLETPISSSSPALLGWKYKIQENNRRTVLALWMEVESILLSEMKIHFVEQDVENISDQKTAAFSPAFAAVNQASIMPSKLESDADVADSIGDDAGPIFPPSVKLAASVYRVILRYADSVQEIFKEEGYLAKSEQQVTPSKPLTVLEAINAKNSTISFDSMLLTSIQEVLERELIPVIQGSVNQSMREIQLSSRQSFAPPQRSNNTGNGDDSKAMGVTASMSAGNGNALNDLSCPCIAAQLCLREARPLFHFWLQLPQHSDMVVTILDRLVRGFVSSAREEIESLMWQTLSGQEKYKTAIVSELRSNADPFFLSYRKQLYGGKTSTEDIIASFASGRGISAVTEILQQTEKNKILGSNAATMTSYLSRDWAPFWEVANPKYLVSIDKIVRDLTVIGTISSIAYSCDWLISHLSRACGVALKNLTGLFNQQARSNTIAKNVIPSSELRSGDSNPKASRDRHEIQQMQEPLLLGLLAYTKELSKLSEDCWALLQSEAQISCFYYLHQLAHMKINQANSVAENNRPQPASTKAGSTATDKDKKSNADSSVSGATEANIIALLSQHLLKLQDNVRGASSSRATAVVMAPLAHLVPRIIQKCVASIFLNHSATFYASNASPTASGSNRDLGHNSKARLLKLVVIAQQNLNMVYEAAQLEAGVFKAIQDIANDAFEHVRRYVSLMDLTMNDLRGYVTTTIDMQKREKTSRPSQISLYYDVDDFRSIWKFVQQKSSNVMTSSNDTTDQNFEEFWSSLTKGKILSSSSPAAATASMTSPIQTSFSPINGSAGNTTIRIQGVSSVDNFSNMRSSSSQQSLSSLIQPSSGSSIQQSDKQEVKAAVPSINSTPANTTTKAPPFNPFAGWKK